MTRRPLSLHARLRRRIVRLEILAALLLAWLVALSVWQWRLASFADALAIYAIRLGQAVTAAAQAGWTGA